MGNNINGWYTDSIGTKRHYRNGKCHREDGPAVIYPDSYQIWYRNGLTHREDGPAVIFPDGFRAWWLNGKTVCMGDVLDTPEKLEAYFLEETIRLLT